MAADDFPFSLDLPGVTHSLKLRVRLSICIRFSQLSNVKDKVQEKRALPPRNPLIRVFCRRFAKYMILDHLLKFIPMISSCSSNRCISLAGRYKNSNSQMARYWITRHLNSQQYKSVKHTKTFEAFEVVPVGWSGI